MAGCSSSSLRLLLLITSISLLVGAGSPVSSSALVLDGSDAVAGLQSLEQTPARVSGDSPFAGCTMASYGTLYSNAEAEPYVAADPANPANIVGAWQQDRWSSGAAQGIAAGYSMDGGASWTEVPLPFTSCVTDGLAYDRASDPWLSFGPDGTLYASAITLGKDGSNAVATATSSDGGKTWTNVREVSRNTGTPREFFNDKESITADPTTPGVAYAVWTRLESGGSDQESEGQSGSLGAPAYFSKTSDGGQTWSEPKAITPANAGEATGNQVLVDPKTGTLYDFFDLIAQTSKGRMSYTVGLVKSTDGGDTWSETKRMTDIRSAPVRVPNSRQTVRAGGIIPSAAIDPSSGKLYVVWMDARFSNGQFPEVAIATSTDGGDNWSAPVRVNTPFDVPAFTPAVSVNASGTVAVTYYDFRNWQSTTSTPVGSGTASRVGQSPVSLGGSQLAATPGLATDYWVTFSTDGGATFVDETHLSGPFDMLSAPNSGGYFLGDYQGLAPDGDGFVSLFVRSNTRDRANATDVFALSLSEPTLSTQRSSSTAPGNSEGAPGDRTGS